MFDIYTYVYICVKSVYNKFPMIKIVQNTVLNQ